MATISFKTFLASTLFTSALCAMENHNDLHSYLVGSSPVVRRIASTPHGIKEILYQMAQEIGRQGVATVKEGGKCIYYGGKLVWHGEYGVIAGELIEQSLIGANQKMFSQFFKPKAGRNHEFDVDALRPLIEKIRLNICWMIDYFSTNKTMYGYEPATGKEIRIYENKTLFRTLIEACIPDFVPGKGLLISFADFKPIRNYLLYKFDEMIVMGLFSLYQEMTGRTIKQSIADWVNKPANGKEHQQDKGKEKLPHNSIEQTQEREPISESVFESSIDDHLFTQSLMGQGFGEQATVFLSRQEENAPKKEVKEAASHVWCYVHPRLVHFLRKAIEDVIIPPYKNILLDVSDYLQKKYVSPITHITLLGTTLLGGVGIVGVWGIPIGLGGYYIANAIAGKAVDGVQSSLKDTINQFIQYHLYQIFPYSRQEHYLYHLNDKPTKDERLLLALDYGAQEKLRKETFIKALLADVMAYSWLSFLNLSGVDELKERPNSSVSQKNRLSAMICLGKIAKKKKRGQLLTEKEECLLKNLEDFPSYDVKEEELTLLNLWGARKKDNIERAKQLAKEHQRTEEKLIRTYELYGYQIPGEIALAYQSLGMWGGYEYHDRLQLDYMEVHKIIKKSLRKHIGNFSPNDLTMLEEAVNDGDFLMEFIEMNIVGPVKCVYQSVIERICPPDAERVPIDIGESQARAVLQSQEFITALICDAGKRKHEEYLKKYGSDIDYLEKSVLGFGLSLVDIIDLHKMMNEEDRANYRCSQTYPYEIALKEAVAYLKGGEKERDYHPTIHAISEELDFLSSKLRALVQGDKLRIARHYADIFIDNVSKNPETFRLILEKLGQFEQSFKDEDLRSEQPISLANFPQLLERYKEVDSEKLQHALLKYNLFIRKNLLVKEGEWLLFNLFRKELPSYVKSPDVRSQAYTYIAHFILDFLLERAFQPDTCVVGDITFYMSREEGKAAAKSIEESKEDKRRKGDSGGENEKENNFSSPLFDKETSYNLKDGRVRSAPQEYGQGGEALKIPITPYADLGTYDVFDFTGFNAATIVNKLINRGDLKDVTVLSPEDLGTIHQEIQAMKRQKAEDSMCSDTICFIDKHLSELFAFKRDNLPKYKGRLFYGYTEIVDEILAHNKRQIEGFERNRQSLDKNDSTNS